MCIMSSKAAIRLADGTGILKVTDYTYDRKWQTVLRLGKSSTTHKSGAVCLGDVLLHEDVGSLLHMFYFSHIFCDAKAKKLPRGIFLDDTKLVFAEPDGESDCMTYEVTNGERVLQHPLFSNQELGPAISFEFYPFAYGGVGDFGEWTLQEMWMKGIWNKWFYAEQKDMKALFACLTERNVINTRLQKRAIPKKQLAVGIGNWDGRVWHESACYQLGHSLDPF